MKADVRNCIVTVARENMRAHALGWREELRWNDRVGAVVRLRRAILWREVARTVERTGAPHLLSACAEA